MITKPSLRIIPCLDIDGGLVVKGRKFLDLQEEGDPAELAKRYEEEGADEIAILDISATVENRRTALGSIAKVRKIIGIPLLVGGGIKNKDDARRLLNSGADRVSVNSAAVRNPAILDILSNEFGKQCLVLAIDAHKINSGTTQGSKWQVVIDGGRVATSLDCLVWAIEGAVRGVGEILLTSIDQDGMGSGYDVQLISALAAISPIPFIASGGVGKESHFLQGAQAGASALLAAGVFHRQEHSIKEIKQYLINNGQVVRL